MGGLIVEVEYRLGLFVLAYLRASLNHGRIWQLFKLFILAQFTLRTSINKPELKELSYVMAIV